MVKIYVVDNGGQWTHREWRVLKYLDVETKIVPNTISYTDIKDVDGLVLSGGAPRVGVEGELGNCGDLLDESTFPILGICAGHQYMARHFGGTAIPAPNAEFGKVELHIIKKDVDIFNDVPETSIVWLSHHDEVSKLPPDFERIAESESCKIQGMKHKKRPLIGLQFHPEVEHTDYGVQIFKNFISLCRSK